MSYSKGWPIVTVENILDHFNIDEHGNLVYDNIYHEEFGDNIDAWENLCACVEDNIIRAGKDESINALSALQDWKKCTYRKNLEGEEELDDEYGDDEWADGWPED